MYADRVRLRATLVHLLVLTVATSFDFESLLHAHRDGEAVLRARALAVADAAAPCGAAPHWDRARAGSQSACAACLLSASPPMLSGAGDLELAAMPQPVRPGPEPEGWRCTAPAGPRAVRGPPARDLVD